MNFKKIIALILVIAVCCSIAVGLTMAYMTDEDKATNVMVVGNIDIEQREHDRNGNDFQQGQTLLPIVGSASQKVRNYPAPANYIDKIVTVENTGKNDAYVRTFVAIPVYEYSGYNPADASTSILHWNGFSYGDKAPDYPAATWLPLEKKHVPNYWHWGKKGTENYWPGNTNGWNMFTTEINGQPYEVYVVTHVEPLKAGQITAPNLTGVYLDSRVDFNGTNYIINGEVIKNFDGTVEVLVATQAVQYDEAWNVWTALDAAFGAPSETNHPWVPEIVNDETGLLNGGTLQVNDDVVLSSASTEIKRGTDLVVTGTISAERGTTTSAEEYSTLTFKANGTISGNGNIQNTSGYAVTLKKEGATLIINGGNFSGGATAINVVQGHLVINGGIFKDTNTNDNGHFLINCIDGNYKNGTATVSITGGSFFNWNPAANTSEGANTNFLADGYEVIEEVKDGGTWYTVVPAN